MFCSSPFIGNVSTNYKALILRLLVSIAFSLTVAACDGGGPFTDGDTTSPTITLLGENPLSLLVGSTYSEPGATAIDDVDGDITSRIEVNSSAVDTAHPGNYLVTYNVSDEAGNAAAEVTRTVNVILSDSTAPVISMLGPNPLNLTVGETFTDPGTTAMDNIDGDITANIMVGGDSVDTGSVGSYSITYNVSDEAGNAAAELTRTVNVILSDSTAPVISMLGPNPLNLTVDEPFTDPGATAMDNVDGDITANIVIGGDSVDTGSVGSYHITYNVSDEAGNAAAEVTRTVNVILSDSTAPVISMLGPNPLNLIVGDTFTDPGATAMDNVDGDITANIVVGGDSVDTGSVGSYHITYNVSNEAGNAAAEVTRTVNVILSDSTAPVISMLGPNPLNLTVGDTFTDPGATAMDNVDGDITANIVIGGDSVDTGSVGSYSITYNVSDEAGNAATEVIRTVIVENTEPPVITGNVIYVAPATATGDCAITPDYDSVGEALAAATPGDGVRLLPGTYTTPVNFPHGGDVGSPIILTYTPESECSSGGGVRSAIIDCTNAGRVNCVTSDHGNVVIDGLEVRGAFYNGIKVDGHLNGTPDHHSYGCWGGYCQSEGHYNTNGADNIIIQNNYVHDIGYDGIKIGHVNNITIEGNEIYNTGRNSTQQGIDLVGAYGAVIRNNLIHDDSDSTMLIGLFAKGGSENILIENNYVANILPPFAAIEIGGDTEWYNTRYTPSEVDFDINTEILNNDYNNNLIDCSGSYSGDACRYDTVTMAEARHVVVRGNVIVNSDPGLSFRNAYDVKVYNNSVINSGWEQGWVKLWTDGNHGHPTQELRFYNNLFYNDNVGLTRGVAYDKQQGTIVDNTVGFAFENNLLHPMGGGTPALGMPASLIPVNEQIIADPSLDSQYQPQSGSPAIDAGLDLIDRGITTVEYETAHPFVDRNGTGFPQNGLYDVGAFEFTP